MRRLLLAFTAATSLAAAAPTLAQNVGLRPHPEINLTGFSGEPEDLPRAVTTIESLSGGRVAAIRYDNIDGVPGYDVVLSHGANVRFQRLSRPSRNLVSFTEQTTPKWMLDWRSERNANLVANARVPLADAIRTAEAHTRGVAVAAGIAHSAASPNTRVHAYNVSILRNGTQRRVAVNSNTGRMIANPRALDAW